jgi:quercetin dioxygenase-like cupin family protein
MARRWNIFTIQDPEDFEKINKVKGPNGLLYAVEYLDKGDGIEPHIHPESDHCALLVQGEVEVLGDHPHVLRKGSKLELVKAGHIHGYKAMVDGTVFLTIHPNPPGKCIYISDPNIHDVHLASCGYGEIPE